MAEKQRFILVIDEYPYVARASKSLASTLQLFIDKYKDTSKLFLVLCGSSMSYMEDNVLAYKAPLYGRRTAQLKIQPFEFWEVCRCFKNFSDEDKALAYGIMGVEDNNTALFGECKWKNEKVDTGVLETLVERSNIFHYNKKHYYLFSKIGFTQGCVELAQKMGNVTLVSYVQMLKNQIL